MINSTSGESVKEPDESGSIYQLKRSSVFGGSNTASTDDKTKQRHRIPIYGEDGKVIIKSENDNQIVKEEEEDKESELETDEEMGPAVPTHKGRRLIRKMEYDDQIEKSRSKSVQSDDESEIHVPKKRKQIELNSDHSRSSSPHKFRNFSGKDALGRTKLQKNCIRGKIDTVRELIKAGADVNQPDHAGNTPLHELALNGHYDIAKLLISHGAKVNVQSGIDDLDTPLIDACAYNHIDIIELLLENGADPTLRNASGQNAMDLIDQDENGADKLNKLIKDSMKKFNANDEPVTRTVNQPLQNSWIDLTTKEGREEIYQRAAEGDETFVGNYLANGGKPHPKLLIIALRNGQSNVVSLLLAFGAKIEKSVEGESALLQTVGRGHFDTVKMLLDNGADPTRVNKDGVSVLDRAHDPKLITDENEIELLKEYIKKKNDSKKLKKEDVDKKLKIDLKKKDEEKRRDEKRREEKRKEEKRREEKREEERKEEEKREEERKEEERKLKRKSEEIEKSRKKFKEMSKESTPELKKTPPPIPVLTPEEEELKRLRELELIKQREQWEQHKKAQREAKALDIMRNIEENKKRREEEERKHELKKIEELKILKQKEDEEKLQIELKLKENEIMEEIERRKLIREFYLPGILSTNFQHKRTLQEALNYLPLYVVNIDSKDYVCDLQIILLLGIEDFHKRFSSLSKIEINENEKTKLWRFFFPMIGINYNEENNFNVIDKLRQDGLNKFQKYQLSWILLTDIESILKSDEFNYLSDLLNLRWITKIELEIDYNKIENENKTKPIDKEIRNVKIPIKFRGNKKFQSTLQDIKKKSSNW